MSGETEAKPRRRIVFGVDRSRLPVMECTGHRPLPPGPGPVDKRLGLGSLAGRFLVTIDDALRALDAWAEHYKTGSCNPSVGP